MNPPLSKRDPHLKERADNGREKRMNRNPSIDPAHTVAEMLGVLRGVTQSWRDVNEARKQIRQREPLFVLHGVHNPDLCRTCTRSNPVRELDVQPSVLRTCWC